MKFRIFFGIAIFLQYGLAFKTSAQQVMMQGYFWDYPKTGQGYNWSDTLRLKAAELGAAGFTHVWFPPFAGNGNKSGGYDPKDLFIGDVTTQTSLGTISQIKAMTAAFTANSVKAVGDMVYNHRDGGKAETNTAAADYILYYAGNNNGSSQDPTHTEPNSDNTYKSPYPSDRYDMIIPIGGSTGLGVGTYYISIGSRTGTYNGSQYMLHATTTKAGGGQAWSFVNGCGAGSNAVTITNDIAASGNPYLITLKQGYFNKIDFNGDIDEFQLNITSNDFNAAGDTIVIQAVNLCGAYSNHTITKIWYTGTNSDIANAGTFNGTTDTDDSHKNLFNASYKLKFRTYTDFSALPSGRGSLNWTAFRPNYTQYGTSYTGGASTTCLGPNWSMESMDYFYDYDHNESNTRDTLIAWTKWAWSELGVRALRMDAVKHFEPTFVSAMLDSMYKSGRTPDLVVGEWYGNEIQNQKNWINYVNNGMATATKAAISPKVFDFALHDALKNACDAGADPRHVYFDGLNAQGLSGFNIVTFLNNHDMRDATIANSDALVWNNPMLGYAYLLTNNQIGVPTVFYPDYYGYPAHNTIYGSDTISFNYHPTGLQPMKNEIDKLIKIQKNFINGSQSVDYLNHYGGILNPAPSPNYWQSGQYYKTLLYQLNATGSAGGKETIVAINFSSDTLKVNHLIAVRNDIAEGTVFTDLLQKSSFATATVDNQNRIYIQLPPKSYTVFGQGSPACFDLNNLVKKNALATTTTPSLCEGNAISLSADGGTNFSWTGPNNFISAIQNPNISNVSTAASGTYSVAVSGCGTTSTATTAITVNPKPTIPTISTSRTTVCFGDNITLTATNCSGTVAWSNNQTGTSILLNNVIANSTFSATCTSNSCISDVSNSLNIVVIPLNLSLSTNAPAGISLFQAKNITFSAAVVGGVGVLAGSNVTYKAGTSVLLLPNFKVESGGVFRLKFKDVEIENYQILTKITILFALH